MRWDSSTRAHLSQGTSVYRMATSSSTCAYHWLKSNLTALYQAIQAWRKRLVNSWCNLALAFACNQLLRLCAVKDPCKPHVQIHAPAKQFSAFSSSAWFCMELVDLARSQFIAADSRRSDARDPGRLPTMMGMHPLHRDASMYTCLESKIYHWLRLLEEPGLTWLKAASKPQPDGNYSSQRATGCAMFSCYVVSPTLTVEWRNHQLREVENSMLILQLLTSHQSAMQSLACPILNTTSMCFKLIGSLELQASKSTDLTKSLIFRPFSCLSASLSTSLSSTLTPYCAESMAVAKNCFHTARFASTVESLYSIAMWIRERTPR